VQALLRLPTQTKSIGWNFTDRAMTARSMSTGLLYKLNPDPPDPKRNRPTRARPVINPLDRPDRGSLRITASALWYILPASV